jgi:taurine dioxygenase
MEYRRISITKLTPHVGAEIGGVDLAKIDDETFREVHDALMDHGVVFFRDQDLTHEQHKAFGRRFGPLHIHPASPGPEGHPEILVIHADEKSRYVAGGDWHSDVSCDVEPPLGSVLYLEQVPEVGGDTLFASMYAAYDALSEPMKAFLCGLSAIHTSTQVYGARNARPTRAGETEFPSAEHPVIRTHPVTKRKGIFVNRGFTTRIRGVTREESRALLEFLFAHCASPEFQCRFRWQRNSVAFWDNRCVQHHAVWDYYPATRHGYRVTIQGDRPYFEA